MTSTNEMASLPVTPLSDVYSPTACGFVCWFFIHSFIIGVMVLRFLFYAHNRFSLVNLSFYMPVLVHVRSIITANELAFQRSFIDKIIAELTISTSCYQFPLLSKWSEREKKKKSRKTKLSSHYFSENYDLFWIENWLNQLMSFKNLTIPVSSEWFSIHYNWARMVHKCKLFSSHANDLLIRQFQTRNW